MRIVAVFFIFLHRGLFRGWGGRADGSAHGRLVQTHPEKADVRQKGVGAGLYVSTALFWISSIINSVN